MTRVPAAFGRLCVETSNGRQKFAKCWPAAFGRLCVETAQWRDNRKKEVPAAFGRLCVETSLLTVGRVFMSQPPSGGCVLKRDRCCKLDFAITPAAFGRLCVETAASISHRQDAQTSRLRAAVC